MDTGSYRFTLGGFRCVSVSDGAFNYALEAFFANVPGEEVEERAPPASPAHRPRHHPVHLPVRRHGSAPGADRYRGGKSRCGSRQKMFPSVDHATTVTGKLLGNLEAAGIEPSTVDTVIITHAHPDHVGGTLDERGALVFANARYVVPAGGVGLLDVRGRGRARPSR